MAQARRFDHNAMLAVLAAALSGPKAAGRPGRLQEAIISHGRAHPRSGPGTDRHWWFAAKLFVAIVVTNVAA